MWRNAVVLGVCFVITITLAVFAGAELVRVSLVVLPLFMLAWLALAVDTGRNSSRAVTGGSEADSPRRRHDPALDRIAELADVGVVQMSRDGTLEFASRRARELLGFETEASAVERWPAVAASIRRNSDPNSTSSGSYEVEASSGPLLLNFKVHPVYEEEWSGYLVQIRDRRALAALESDLRTAARQRALNQIFVGIAHDVRGALNAAILNLESVKAAAQDEASDGVLPERLDVVRDELDRLHRSLEMLLGETAPEDSDRRAFDLSDVARSVSALLETKARQQGVTIACENEGSAVVASRPDRIRETLLILAINAIEAMPGGGALRFVTGRKNGWVRIDVADSGGGIRAEALPRVFDLHYTTKPLGTGVGLWAARSIVESEQGKLEVVATGHGGTTFRISLPPLKED
ncbi:MAG: ATP-binding protein [Thermoanaerobaculia bacterium]|jgi:signal transduction histidine kinase